MDAQKIYVSREELDAVDLLPALPIISWHTDHRFFFAPNEHYRLLAVLARQAARAFPTSAILDLGSPYACSAAALCLGAMAAGSSIDVHTFDLGSGSKAVMPPDARAYAERSGIQIHVKVNEPDDMLERVMRQAHQAHLIALDTEPHDGVLERKIVEALMDVGYRGLLVVDEIRLNESMLNFWKWVPMKKIDVTHHAHWSGTGIIVFDDRMLDVIASQ